MYDRSPLQRRGWLHVCLWLGMSSTVLVKSAFAEEWVRHTIDNTSRGADGVKLLDFNRDDLIDLVTGWEEGGQVAIYLQPKPDQLRQPWPKIVVGSVQSPEDAVFVDLDDDGNTDVVSCCEGKTRSVYLHRREGEPPQWTTTAIPCLAGKAQWMFAQPAYINRDGYVDLVLGAKGPGAELGWLDGDRWYGDTWHPFCPVGWVMSIEWTDMNGDGALDILFSDRKGPHRGIHWLQNPGSSGTVWRKHTIGGTDREVMFLAEGDINRDQRRDIACAVSGGPILWFQRNSDDVLKWMDHEIAMRTDAGSGKGIAIADIDNDFRPDIVFSCENAAGKHGVGWLSPTTDVTAPSWTFHSISGKREGIKFDLIQVMDLDCDGDYDLVTCEERDNLGVIWYENPTAR